MSNENVLAICPRCGETIDIRNTHKCSKETKKLLQSGVFLRKRAFTVFQRH